MMGLHGFGLLMGNVVASRAQRSGKPHWLLMVQPGNLEHPAHPGRSQLATKRTGLTAGAAISDCTIGGRSGSGGKALIKKSAKLGLTPNFFEADTDLSVPRLDFVRGGIVNPGKFVDLPAGANPLRNRFERALANWRKRTSRRMLWSRASAPAMQSITERESRCRFTGIDNIHMGLIGAAGA
jgi:hypothetical protein